MAKFYYHVAIWGEEDPDINVNNCYEIEYGRAVDVEDEWDLESLAEACADDFLSNHDGWECRSWPGDSLPFVLFNDNEEPLGTFNVYLEYEPTFSATRAKAK